MVSKCETKISAHSAAADLARKRVEAGLMNPDEALEFTDWIYMMVNTGQLPDDLNLLALIEHDWNIFTSEGHTSAEIIKLKIP